MQQALVRAHPCVIVPVDHLPTVHYVNGMRFIVTLKQRTVHLEQFIGKDKQFIVNGFGPECISFLLGPIHVFQFPWIT